MNTTEVLGDLTSLADAIAQAIWHLFFLHPSEVLCTDADQQLIRCRTEEQCKKVRCALQALRLLNAVGYHRAGRYAEALLSGEEGVSYDEWWERLNEMVGRSLNVSPAVAAQQLPSEWHQRLSRLCYGDPASLATTPATSVLEAMLQVEEKSPREEPTDPTSSWSRLYAALAAGYGQHLPTSAKLSAEQRTLESPSPYVPLFHFSISETHPTASPTAAVGSALRRHEWCYYEGRLYAALACGASLNTPGPLSRLLTAFIFQGDKRLAQHLSGGSPAKEKMSAKDCIAAQFRLQGVVSGVVEYAMFSSAISPSLAAAQLRCMSAPSSSPTAWATQSISSPARYVCRAAGLLLAGIIEECSYYSKTSNAATPAEKSSPVIHSIEEDAAMVVIHAVQELLYTVVLGEGTHLNMRNRPEPSAKASDFAVSRTGLVTTNRALSLAEADALSQQFFPALVQQLGFEWVWSPLLRHLSGLDKLSISPDESPATKGQRLAVRWSSQFLMDTILLSLSPKTYPQRLLNILPGSYERLLDALDLLPAVAHRSEGEDEISADPHPANAGHLFALPDYYEEPAAALVSYFQHNGLSGIRIDEVERLLYTATSSYAMIVRLKAQAPPSADNGVDEDERAQAGNPNEKGQKANYPLSLKRVEQLWQRYQGEVLLAAVVVYTQLRVPSQVQQLMRLLSGLFLKIRLAWRPHHDGGATWLLQRQGGGLGKAGASLVFTAEAQVLWNHVGYEFYPLEWLPMIAQNHLYEAAASHSNTATSNTMAALSSGTSASLPYSLFAAVAHQFQVHLRGTPLGSSGAIERRHPAGPRASVVVPPVASMASTLFPTDSSDVAGAEAVKLSMKSWRRAERFLVGLMEVCYLDAKTSSSDLEGRLAVSATRRVLTEGGAGGSITNGAGDSSSAGTATALAITRLRSLLQKPAVMDAVWGTMNSAEHGTSDDAGGSPPQRQQQQGVGSKRRRAWGGTQTAALDGLEAMEDLLLSYGASSFDATVEAADFAFTVAQSFLPSSSGCSRSLLAAAVAPGQHSKVRKAGKVSEELLQSAKQWCHACIGATADKAKINMMLEQQKTTPSVGLAVAYNSGTIDYSWLARRAMRSVPLRIMEKVRLQGEESIMLRERRGKWEHACLPSGTAPVSCSAAPHRAIDPLLLEQWSQWQHAMDSLGLVHMEPHSFGGADDISVAQWLWFSPYFVSQLT